MKKLLFTLLILALSLPALAHAQEDDPCYAINGSPDPETEECILTGGLDIRMALPLELAEHPYALGVAAQFLQEVRAAMIQNYAAGNSDTTYLTFPWSLYSLYDIYQYSEDVISINFTISEYTGGAHPNSYFRSFTFDVVAEQEIALADLFLPDSDPFSVIGPLVEADLLLQQGGNADPAWISEGTSTNPANYQNFALDEDSLILFFPPYQVGPYALGTFAVVLPLNQLSSILADPFKP
jgi:hypothetical protein